MKQVIIDCAAIADRSAFHDILSTALGFPDWYGKNLDALHDCLSAISEDTHLVLENWQAAENSLGHYATRIRTVFLRTEDESIHFHLSFQ